MPSPPPHSAASPSKRGPARRAAGSARVMVRPEQIVLGEVAAGAMEGTVASYEYFGHDAVVRVRPGSEGLPDLVVRVTGGTPLEPGHRVGLSVRRHRRGLAGGAGRAHDIFRITPS